MIIGTAGHIDHGKTALVKALTGVDTDRLPEEKARGITLELGFAYARGAGETELGFIDVPGHERLIHTMLAGAAGIDYVLLVVAADDGPMPQTREHLQIADLLGLTHGALVISKIDRVEPERVAQVTAAARALCAGSALAQAPLFEVSALSGAGIAQLRAHLEQAALAHATRVPREAGHFRLAIDRAFTLPGAGVVVTGTVYAGTVTVGDELMLSPRGVPVRVRSIHAHNRVAASANAGARCGINITAQQLSKDAIARGDWLLAPPLHGPTQRLDAQVRLLADAAALGASAPVHLHVGAAHVLARVVPLESERIAPGTSALAQLVLERPIGVLNSDRLVLRDASARCTIGGGHVLDIRAPARHRRAAQRLAQLHAAQIGEAGERLQALAQLAPLGIDLTRYGLDWNSERAANGLASAALVEIAGHAFSAALWAQLKQRTLALLAAFHASHSDELGLDGARLRRMLAPALANAVFGALAQQLLEQGSIAKTGPWLHLPDHSIELQPAERALAERVLRRIRAGAFDPPWVRDLARSLGVEEGRMRTLLLRLTRRAELFQVTRDLFYGVEAVSELARIARELEQREGEIRAAQFRDCVDLGRKRAIQILEFFDRIGYTRRAGEAHRLRSESLLQLGANAR